MRSDLVDLTVILVREIDAAVGVKETEDQESLVWLPKSLIEIEPTSKPGIVVVTLPEHLAHSKGLV